MLDNPLKDGLFVDIRRKIMPNNPITPKEHQNNPLLIFFFIYLSFILKN
jgi:hypothetical protein